MIPGRARVAVCLLALIAGACRARDDQSPPPAQTAIGGEITWSCDEKSECDVVATTAGGERLPVFKGAARSPSARKLGDRISEFKASCGSPCTFSIFVDFTARRVSKPFENVLASDPGRAIVASAGADQIEVRRMFGPFDRVVAVKRDFAPVAALVSAIRSAEFVPSGGLKVRYLKGAQYEETEDVIPLDLGPLGS
jgi:hypothetical protein